MSDRATTIAGDEGGMGYLQSLPRRLVTIYLPLAIFVFVLLFPFYWMAVTSVKPNEEMTNFNDFSPFWVVNPTLQHIRYLLFETSYPGWLWNTILISVASTFLSLLASVFAAYAIERLRFSGSRQVGLAVFLAAQRRASTTRRALAAALAAAFAGAIPAAWLFERVLDLDQAPWLFRSAQHRVEIWWRAAGRTLETPLLGQGIDASRALKPMGETSQFDPLTESLLPLHPHNAFLQVWLELGALGAVLGLAVALLVLAGTRRLERDDQPYALASFTAALAMVSTAYGIWQAWWMAGMLAAGLMLVLATRVPRGGS